MVLETDAKAPEISGRFNECFSKDESLGLGSVRVGGSVDGLRESGFTKDDCAGKNSAWANTTERDTTVGKILQRLKLIETRYSNYVRSHQSQLEAQLSESKASEAEFKKELSALEQEIYNLASQQGDMLK